MVSGRDACSATSASRRRRAGEEWATGDLGEIDADGYVYVRGRLRNIFITSLGRNVSPEWVERELAQQPGIRSVMVHGEARPYAVALVVPSDATVTDADIERRDRRGEPTAARLRARARWVRAPEPFTFQNGLLTANGRLRRAEILRPPRRIARRRSTTGRPDS